jgi:hypothetical protein
MVDFLVLLVILESWRSAFAKEPEQLGSCPPAYRSSELRVYSFLTNPLLPLALERNGLDLGTASSEQIQLLTDAEDREICDALWTAIQASQTDLSPSDQLAFYRSGNRFFVAIRRSGRNARPGVTQLDGNSTLDLYDDEYRLIARLRA